MAKKARRKTATEVRLQKRVNQLEAKAIERERQLFNCGNRYETVKKHHEECANNITRLERINEDLRTINSQDTELRRLQMELDVASGTVTFWKKQCNDAIVLQEAVKSVATIFAIPLMLNRGIRQMISDMETLSEFAHVVMTDEVYATMNEAMATASAVAIKNEINATKARTTASAKPVDSQ